MPTRGEKLRLPMGASVFGILAYPIAWIKYARRRTGKDHRLGSGDEGRDLVVLL
jgi:hypothetical protein